LENYENYERDESYRVWWECGFEGGWCVQ
jgi:hypothetical protein